MDRPPPTPEKHEDRLWLGPFTGRVVTLLFFAGLLPTLPRLWPAFTPEGSGGYELAALVLWFLPWIAVAGVSLHHGWTRVLRRREEYERGRSAAVALAASIVVVGAALLAPVQEVTLAPDPHRMVDLGRLGQRLLALLYAVYPTLWLVGIGSWFAGEWLEGRRRPRPVDA